MSVEPKIIIGNYHTDERGRISYINDFDMTLIKRFYCIKHSDTTYVRGWRGHKIEQRWFHVFKGAFEIKLVKVNDWKNPDRNLFQQSFILNSQENVVLHFPSGFASSIKANDNNSDLLVFADYLIEHAKKIIIYFHQTILLTLKNAVNEN